MDMHAFRAIEPIATGPDKLPAYKADLPAFYKTYTHIIELVVKEN